VFKLRKDLFRSTLSAMLIFSLLINVTFGSSLSVFSHCSLTSSGVSSAVANSLRQNTATRPRTVLVMSVANQINLVMQWKTCLLKVAADLVL
jgi:hypothetical protein